VLTADRGLAQQVVAEIGELHGGTALQGEYFPFDKTPYYEPEMGPGLQRCYCAFDALVPAECLASVKIATWEIEQRLMADGCRRVNLDPGLLDDGKVVLASFKHAPQKLYLGQGVYADMVLFYAYGAWQPLPWTFPDLKGGEHRELFTAARTLYKQRLKLDRGSPSSRAR